MMEERYVIAELSYSTDVEQQGDELLNYLTTMKDRCITVLPMMKGRVCSCVPILLMTRYGVA
jgi:flagellar basal body-associated protein FliL